MKASREDLLRLLRLVGVTEDDEIDCDEFVHRVAAVIERGETARDDKVVQHLKVCPECLEEYEALYRALRDEK